MSTRGYLNEKVSAEKLNSAFKGVKLEVENGVYFLKMDLLLNYLPKMIQKYIARISHQEYFSTLVQRECGLYDLGSDAHGELDRYGARSSSSKEPVTYTLNIVGRDIESVKKLAKLIKGGEIRPTTSYEAPQGGLSRAELEKELEATKEERNKLVEELEKAQMNEDIAYKNLREKQEEATRLNARISAVNKYIEHRLESGVFPLIKKSSVTNTLRDLLCIQ